MTTPNRRLISLGFAEERFPEGQHFCDIFRDEFLKAYRRREGESVNG